MHVHLHAKAEEKWSRPVGTIPVELPKAPPQAPAAQRDSRLVVESLQRAIEGLHWEPRSHWSRYYAVQPSYGQAALDRKRDIVTDWLQRLRPGTVWDLGANTGQFSAMAIAQGARAVACDVDPACVELMYRQMRSSAVEQLLPLVADLANPSPAIGWANAERMTLEQRGPADVLMALALVHHLAIGNNVPFEGIAAYFSRLARRAIVEFVPRADAMVHHMLAGRDERFGDYDAAAFERAFALRFTIDERVVLTPSERVLYLMTAR